MSISIGADVLTNFFIAILLLVLAAHVFGYLFSRLHMPRVVGEIFGGLLLGPTVLGFFVPELYTKIFLEQGELLAAIYNLGLVLLMFTSGFSIEHTFSTKDKKLIGALIIGTTAIPFLFGWAATSVFDLETLIGTANNVLSLKLVIAVAIAITSIPVISKIFLDLGILNTPFAKITLATATIHDIVLWIFISIATGLVASQALSIVDISGHVIISILFFVMALVVAPMIIRLATKFKIRPIPQNHETIFITLVLLAFTVAASFLGVNLVFGAFLAGVIVGYLRTPKFDDSKHHVKDFATAFFIPAYFAIVGIKLDLIHHLDIPFLIMFTLFAIVVQTIAVLITARLLKYDWLSSTNLAVVLNDRGGPCIVLATLAFDMGIISENFFVTLVLLAIITSLTAGVWLKYVLSKGWPLLKTTTP